MLKPFWKDHQPVGCRPMEGSIYRKQLSRSLPGARECEACPQVPQEGLCSGQPPWRGVLTEGCRSKTPVDTHPLRGLLGKCLFSTSLNFFTCERDGDPWVPGPECSGAHHLVQLQRLCPAAFVLSWRNWFPTHTETDPLSRFLLSGRSRIDGPEKNQHR